jgi:hypothetical protein
MPNDLHRLNGLLGRIAGPQYRQAVIKRGERRRPTRLLNALMGIKRVKDSFRELEEMINADTDKPNS